MKRIVLVALVVGLFLGFGFADAVYTQEETAEEEEITQEDLLKMRSTVHGKRARRNFRLAYWAAGLEGDMKQVYETYGHPSARYREETLGRVEEKWTYIEAGKHFTFRDGRLVRERDLVPSSTPIYSIK